MALYVNRKYPQDILFLGEIIETGLVMGVKGREGYLCRDGMYWVLLCFWLNLDKVLR